MQTTIVKAILLGCVCAASTGFAQDSPHRQVAQLLDVSRPERTSARIELAELGKGMQRRYLQTGEHADFAAAIAAYHYAATGPIIADEALLEAAVALGEILEEGSGGLPADTLAAIACYGYGNARGQARAQALRGDLASRSGFSFWPHGPLEAGEVAANLLSGHPVFWNNYLPAVDPGSATMAFVRIVEQLTASSAMDRKTLVIYTNPYLRNAWNPFASMQDHALESTLADWYDRTDGRIRLSVQAMPAAFAQVAQATMVLRLVDSRGDTQAAPRVFAHQEGFCGISFRFLADGTYAAEQGCEGRSTQSVGYVLPRNDSTMVLHGLPHRGTTQLLDWDVADFHGPVTLQVIDVDGQPGKRIRVALVADTGRLDGATVLEVSETGAVTLPSGMAYGYAAVLERGEEAQRNPSAFVALGPVKGKRFILRLLPGWRYRHAAEVHYLNRPDSAVLTVLGPGRRSYNGDTVLREVGGDPIGYPDLAALGVDALIDRVNASFAKHSKEPAQFRRNTATNTIEIRFQTPHWMELPWQLVLVDSDRRLRYEPYYESDYVLRLAASDGYPLYNIFVDRSIGLQGIDRLRSALLAIGLKQQGKDR